MKSRLGTDPDASDGLKRVLCSLFYSGWLPKRLTLSLEGYKDFRFSQSKYCFLSFSMMSAFSFSVSLSIRNIFFT
jgi:hypothetical protein